MIALVHLALVIAFGDALARRFLPMRTVAERAATALLVGLLASTWLTFLVALAFTSHETPLLPANVLVGAIVAAVGLPWLLGEWLGLGPARGLIGGADRWLARIGLPAPDPDRDRRRMGRWDWVTLAAGAGLVTWMMTSTLASGDGTLLLGLHEYGDFGPYTAIAQSFAIGHNLPPEFPLLAGPPMIWYFLYLFEVGNLTFLGLDPALASNLLASLTLVALLALVMALGERLFRSAAIGRLGAVLFFFHGSLSFVPFLASFASVEEALAGIWNLDHYLASIFPYRGEDWAIWSQNVFINQRHLASGIGIVLIVLLFLLDRQASRSGEAIRETGPPPAPAAPRAEAPRAEAPSAEAPSAATSPVEGAPARTRRGLDGLGVLRDPALPGFVFCGLLLGLLPLWNTPMYVASAVVLAILLVLFPGRVRMGALAIAAAAASIPQLAYLRPESLQTAQYPTLDWGYVVDDPTPLTVGAYLAFIFGPKLVLVAVSLVGATSAQRRFFLAISGALALAFLVQLSIDITQNHKFVNLWLVVANLYVADGLVRLWRAGRDRLGRPGRASPLLGRLAAVGLAGVIVTGGAIDLVPVKNDPLLAIPTTGDRLYEWVRQETDPAAVFLTDIHIVHPILLAGRRIYYGWPAYTFALGYELATREATYRDLYSSRSPSKVVRTLQAEGIAFVAFDDPLRERGFVEDLNEDLYRTHFEIAFDDLAGAYRNLVIFRVPDDPEAWRSLPDAPPVAMTVGGRGDDPGRFAGPRGIAIGPDGSVLVADTLNHRIQRFAADGTYVGEFGGPGDGPGEFDEPYGVAVDARGHVFVADTLHHLLQEFDADGTFVAAWPGPEPAFYGPRDVGVGPDGAVYVVDQGHAQIVRRATDGRATMFGTLGAGDGQLNDPTSVAVAGDLVAVADPTNRRIQLFEAGGAFVRSIAVTAWGAPLAYPDVAFSLDGRTLYASSPATAEILAFDLEGRPTGAFRPTPPEALVEPGAIVVAADGSLLVVDHAADRVVRISTGSGPASP